MDELLRMAFERDDPFTMGEGECFFNTNTHEVRWVLEEMVSLPGPGWIKVPGTPHSEWHDVFKEWLKEVGKSDMYTTSIGLTLKKLDKVDENLRYSWDEKKFDYSEEKAWEWLKKYT